MNSTPVKVLVLDNSKSMTGALKSLQGISKYLNNSKEIEISLATSLPKKNKLLATFKNTYIFDFLEIDRSYKTIFYIPVLLINALKFRRIISWDKIDIIHSNDLYNMLGVLVKIFNPKIKLVYHVRLLPNSYAGKLYPIWAKLIEKYANMIICVSEAVAANFSTKAEVIYDAIEIPEQLPLKDFHSELEFIYLANYTKGKGQEYAIRAFAKAVPSIPPAKLTLYGGTFGRKKNEAHKRHLQEMVKELKIEHMVTLKEFADDPEEVIANADIMLNFSESESFSMTTLEAIAYGTPIIVTDCGGPSEIIEDGISGILVPVNDINAMTDAMIRLATNPMLRQSFSQKGFERAKQKFDLKIQAKKLGAVYNSLLPTATSPPQHESPKSAS